MLVKIVPLPRIAVDVLILIATIPIFTIPISTIFPTPSFPFLPSRLVLFQLRLCFFCQVFLPIFLSLFAELQPTPLVLFLFEQALIPF